MINDAFINMALWESASDTHFGSSCCSNSNRSSSRSSVCPPKMDEFSIYTSVVLYSTCCDLTFIQLACFEDIAKFVCYLAAR